MLRLVAAAVVSSIILGGLSLFMDRRDMQAGSAASGSVATAAAGTFSIDVTLSFTAAAADPFAIATESGNKRSVVSVMLNGQSLFSAAEAPPAGELIAIDDAQGVVVGKNEFLVEADPPLSEANRAHAVRLRVLRDGTPIAEQTVWSEPGARMVAKFNLDVPAARSTEAQRHE